MQISWTFVQSYEFFSQLFFKVWKQNEFTDPASHHQGRGHHRHFLRCRCHWPLWPFFFVVLMDAALVLMDVEKDGQVESFNLLAFQAIKCPLNW